MNSPRTPLPVNIPEHRQQPPGRRWVRPVLIGLGMAAALALLFFLLWPGTTWWVEHVDGIDLNAKDLAAGKDRQDLLDKTRGRLTALATGVLAAVAIIYTASNAKSARRVAEASQETARAAARTAAATEQGLVTGRYTAAIEQLGSDKLDVRLGGIYALERIARDSTRDHPTVIAVLAAFVREHSHDEDARATQAPGSATAAARTRFRPDLQGALTVIGRRDPDHDDVDTDRVDLSNANLAGASLRSARLGRANLRRANLTGADLCDAYMRRAHLSRATLARAHLRRMNLRHASLRAADLRGADLTGADLTGANLDGADLTGVNLTGADLRGVRGVSQEEVRAAARSTEGAAFGPLPGSE